MSPTLYFVILVGAAAFPACGYNASARHSTESESASRPHGVRYEVSYQNPLNYTSGTFGDFDQADLTFSDADGGSSQISEARLPWVLRFTAQRGAHVYISAQTKYRGLIRVRIYVDEVLYKTSTSEGDYVIATASGLVN